MFVAGRALGIVRNRLRRAQSARPGQSHEVAIQSVSPPRQNFMIGVTAAASAGIYLSRGYIDPGLAMPVMLGVLVGSTSEERAS